MKLKPIRKTGLPPLFQQIQGCSLTRFADDVLLSKATVISEGDVFEEDGVAIYNGSTMITIDLSSMLADRDIPKDMADLLLDSVRRSISFKIKLMRIARIETEMRCVPRLAKEMGTELEFTIEQNKLLVDIDIMCPLAEPFTGVDDVMEDR